MRIRRRPRDAVQPSTTPSSPGLCLSAAPPVSSPPRGSTSPSSSAAAAPADVKLPPPTPSVEADGSTWETTPLGPDLPFHGQDHQGEENEGGTGDAAEKRKRGAGGGAEEQGHGVPAKANEEGQRRGEDEAKATVAICKKGDGKGWRCKREAQRGCSLCQYHLAKLRSYSRKKKRAEVATSPPEAPAAATGDTGVQRAARRRRTADGEPGESKGAVLSGGFYYYSGFGPRWGRSRRDRAEDDGRADDGGDSRARRHGDRSDDGDAGAGVEEDYGHGDANGDGKPSKSRSLASLL